LKNNLDPKSPTQGEREQEKGRGSTGLSAVIGLTLGKLEGAHRVPGNWETLRINGLNQLQNTEKKKGRAGRSRVGGRIRQQKAKNKSGIVPPGVFPQACGRDQKEGKPA